jgi:general secretion pathway protein G
MRKHETKSRRRGQAGFTLMELMIVIVILGMLAAIVAPRMIGATDDAKVASAKTQINAFKMALNMYKLEFGTYPTTGEGLQALVTNGKKNFLEQDSVPNDPWGNPYVYVSPGSDGHDFEVVSLGEDASPGGDGYAADIQSFDLQADNT